MSNIHFLFILLPSLFQPTLQSTTSTVATISPDDIGNTGLDCPVNEFFKDARGLECEQLRHYLVLYEDCNIAQDISQRTAAMWVAGNTRIRTDASDQERGMFDGKAAFCIQILDSFSATQIESQDIHGGTAISWSAVNNMPLLLETLLTLQTLQNNSTLKHELLETKEKSIQSTPIHAAVAHNHLATTEILIKFGADIRSKDMNGQTPAMKAALNTRIDILTALLNHDSKAATDVSDTKWSLCHFATYSKNLDMVNYLINNNYCNYDAKDDHGHTPYILATIIGTDEIATLLRDSKINSIMKEHEKWSKRDQLELEIEDQKDQKDSDADEDTENTNEDVSDQEKDKEKDNDKDDRDSVSDERGREEEEVHITQIGIIEEL